MDTKDWLRELVRIMARLREPGGCPWDREQTHATLKEYLSEESAELFDAIDDHDDPGMVEELGDLLLQIVFHCQIASEEGRFSLDDAARVCCEKLIRRHPHVFGDSEVSTAEGVLRQWERIKKDEKSASRPSALSGVPRHLPALHRAQKMQRKAARVGFDWPDADGVVAKIEEELGEVKAALRSGRPEELAGEIGDLLFAVVNLSRFENHQAEELLHRTVRKFERRFRRVEALLAERGRTPEESSLEEMDTLWDQAKREEEPA
ncbi:MAG: Nucleoside triphosphate pyrophosphohydrolase [Lentisphaerae bacterium ADurb.BinA184]|nr:MAG: Nucleoside triphosphate pyrophosphohydrolase [Lentisphaerae bacterium ADurb.BinA184]